MSEFKTAVPEEPDGVWVYLVGPEGRYPVSIQELKAFLIDDDEWTTLDEPWRRG